MNNVSEEYKKLFLELLNHDETGRVLKKKMVHFRDSKCLEECCRKCEQSWVDDYNRVYCTPLNVCINDYKYMKVCNVFNDGKIEVPAVELVIDCEADLSHYY